MQTKEQEMSSVITVEKGCLICGGDVKGNIQSGYYCAVCNVLFSHKDLKAAGRISRPGEPQFVGSKNSNKYHRLDCMCVKNISKENKVGFVSAKQAKSLKFSACGLCLR